MDYGVFTGTGLPYVLGGCMHLFIDADDKETKALYLYATGTTVGNISGGGRSGVDAFCVSNKPPSLICTGGLHAFINVSVSDKVDFFTTAYPSLPQDLPVYNLDKTKKIADDWADLLDNSIDMSLADAGIATVAYWTGGLQRILARVGRTLVELVILVVTPLPIASGSIVLQMVVVYPTPFSACAGIDLHRTVHRRGSPPETNPSP